MNKDKTRISQSIKKITSKGEFIEAGAPDMLSLKKVAGIQKKHSGLCGLVWRAHHQVFDHA